MLLFSKFPIEKEVSFFLERQTHFSPFVKQECNIDRFVSLYKPVGNKYQTNTKVHLGNFRNK